MAKNLIRRYPKVFKALKRIFLYIKYVKNSNGYSNKKLLCKADLEIGDVNKHCFFGYYDKSPWNNSMSNILYHSVNNNNDTILSINVFNVASRKSKVLDNTEAWNWQQGAMLQWISDVDLIYNIRIENKFHAKQICLNSNNEKVFSLPIYTKCKNSSHFLSLNFSRLEVYAKGYGYAMEKEEEMLSNIQDGIWQVNMSTSESSLILSLSEVISFDFKDEFASASHYINHVDYCSNGQSCIFIHRWFSRANPFVSRLLWFDFESRELRTLIDNGHVSHYCWKSDSELLIYATNNKNQKGYFIVDVISGEHSDVITSLPKEDGHPSFNPKNGFVLTDTYPAPSRMQDLYVYNPLSEELKKINSLFSPFTYFDENRCDLHPRWSPDGKLIAVDSTYSGLRTLSIFNNQ